MQASRLKQSLAGRLQLSKTHAIQNLYHGLQDKWGAVLRQTGHWTFAGVLHDPKQGSGSEGGIGDSGRAAKVKTVEGMVDGLSLAENCGGFWKRCCAQQTGMHILVVEALLIAIYST